MWIVLRGLAIVPVTYSIAFITLSAVDARAILAHQSYFRQQSCSARQSDFSDGFEVASIRLADTGVRGWKMEFTRNGFNASGVTLRQLIQEATGVYQDNRLVGGPSWQSSTKYTIQAKFNKQTTREYDRLTLTERRSMLNNLLNERFSLRLHHEARTMPIYELTISNGHPKMLLTTKPKADNIGLKGLDTVFTKGGSGTLEVKNIFMSLFASTLADYVGRTVYDRTGLIGQYDISLRWNPDSVSDSSSADKDFPPLFIALEEQLGLKLIPAKGDVDVIVLEEAHKPFPNLPD